MAGLWPGVAPDGAISGVVRIQSFSSGPVYPGQGVYALPGNSTSDFTMYQLGHGWFVWFPSVCHLRLTIEDIVGNAERRLLSLHH